MKVDADDIIDQAEEQVHRWQKYVRPAADYFYEHRGELFERRELVPELAEHLDVKETVAKEVIAALIGDTVDPVVQVPKDGNRYVGIIDYEEFEGAYGYVDFDDVFGKRNRVICAKCVEEAERDMDVTHATAGDPEGSFDSEASYKELVSGIHKHYDRVHDEVPEDVETGASLASGTTIGGNESWHKGNDGDLYLTTGNDTLIVENRSSDPSSPSTGRIWNRTDL